MEFKLIKQKKEAKISQFEKIIGKYYIDEIGRVTYLFLNERLNNKELNNLQFLRDENELELEKDAIFSCIEIINRLKELGKTNKITLKVCDKKAFDEFIFNQIIPDYKNIVVEYKYKDYYLTDYIYFEPLLYKIVEPAKNLSPFEKYIYAYNIVKNFKEYKECGSPLLARKLYHILINEYVVCVGFCEFLKDLLYKLDVQSAEFSITGKDFKDNSTWGHMRLYVNIKDEKYGINGFYVSDPTWDNDLKLDYYNHLALTNKEAKLECDFELANFNKQYEIFDASSLEDLVLKINDIVKENNFDDLLKIIKELDLNYWNNLKKRLNSLKEPGEKIINELSLFIYNHLNNEVLGDTIMNAVEVVYRHSYGYREEVLEEKLEEVRNINSKRQNCLFPSKIRVDSDTELDIIVLQNKFENSSNKISKY